MANLCVIERNINIGLHRQRKELTNILFVSQSRVRKGGILIFASLQRQWTWVTHLRIDTYLLDVTSDRRFIKGTTDMRHCTGQWLLINWQFPVFVWRSICLQAHHHHHIQLTTYALTFWGQPVATFFHLGHALDNDHQVQRSNLMHVPKSFRTLHSSSSTYYCFILPATIINYYKVFIKGRSRRYVKVFKSSEDKNASTKVWSSTWL